MMKFSQICCVQCAREVASSEPQGELEEHARSLGWRPVPHGKGWNCPTHVGNSPPLPASQVEGRTSSGSKSDPTMDPPVEEPPRST
jgi:hypothetical protein